MNNPAAKLHREIARAAKLGMDYLELTLEPPYTVADDLNPAEVRRWLGDRGLDVVGHTAYYLPLASPLKRLRRAALEELRRNWEVFAALGITQATVHPDHRFPNGYTVADIVARNIETFGELARWGKELGVTVLVENLDGIWGQPKHLRALLAAVPELGWTLDIGHANLGVPQNRTVELLRTCGARLRHVHLSDNDGHRDLHLPLGTGRVPCKRLVRYLRTQGYNGTFTLEVFEAKEGYFRLSCELVREWWQ